MNARQSMMVLALAGLLVLAACSKSEDAPLAAADLPAGEIDELQGELDSSDVTAEEDTADLEGDLDSVDSLEIE